MKICVMSDLHGELPDAHASAELTLICGDIVPLRIQRSPSKCKKWIVAEFLYWALNWPSDKILFIGGNHDFVFDGHWTKNDTAELFVKSDGKVEYMTDPIHYISREGKEYKIFGTPYCHIFGNWAFMREDETLRELYKAIPTDCDIVISHDAADINNLGLVPPNVWHPTEPVNAGNKVLAKAIKLTKPKYYFCGHIHEGNHQVTEIDGTTMANVSLLNDRYKMIYEPL
jgi:Icc-related predicted phosphoesterase